MFSIEPFSAKRHVVRMKDDTLTETWADCKVLGITEVDGEPVYICEIRGTDGNFCLVTADLIRKLP